mmetsp:Transcript_94077/g.251888  ORF Transcript_94077/g.251888 Transcript_94077/m.251888 type:complete len:292 (-) Transcript_94077:448-1323(-)
MHALSTTCRQPQPACSPEMPTHTRVSSRCKRKVRPRDRGLGKPTSTPAVRNFPVPRRSMPQPPVDNPALQLATPQSPQPTHKHLIAARRYQEHGEGNTLGKKRVTVRGETGSAGTVTVEVATIVTRTDMGTAVSWVDTRTTAGTVTGERMSVAETGRDAMTVGTVIAATTVAGTEGITTAAGTVTGVKILAEIRIAETMLGANVIAVRTAAEKRIAAGMRRESKTNSGGSRTRNVSVSCEDAKTRSVQRSVQGWTVTCLQWRLLLKTRASLAKGHRRRQNLAGPRSQRCPQ